MAAVIWPITSHGSLDRPSDLMRYAQRDFYGVEAPAATLTDYRGFNDAAAFTRRQYTAAVVEHAASGVHATVKVPRTVLSITWDGTVYDVRNPSYSQVVSNGARLYGSAVGTASRAAAGTVDVTLTDSLPAASNYKIVDWTGGFVDYGAGTVSTVRVMLLTVTDATHFTVKRLEGSTLSTLAATDGNMRFAVYY